MNEYWHVPKDVNAYVCIWMHGLGASGDDMRMIAESLAVKQTVIRHVFLDAPVRPVTVNQGMMMPAWYDIVGTQLVDREDEEGIQSSYERIAQLIQDLINSGVQSQRIILAGFSQGAAMALYTALNSREPLGGVVVLSGYLPLAQTIQPQQSRQTPMFFGYGRYDTIVMPGWTLAVVHWLGEQRYQHLTVLDYPIDHSVCIEEIHALTQWLEQLNQRPH